MSSLTAPTPAHAPSQVLSSDQGAHGGGGKEVGYGTAFAMDGDSTGAAGDGADGGVGGGGGGGGGMGQGMGAGMDSEVVGMPVGGWLVNTLSEEHGWIRRPTTSCGGNGGGGGGGDNDGAGATDPGLYLKVGDRVVVLPNHSCPVANLSDEYVAVKGVAGDPGEVRMEAWRVEARGAVARLSALEP